MILFIPLQMFTEDTFQKKKPILQTLYWLKYRTLIITDSPSAKL